MAMPCKRLRWQAIQRGKYPCLKKILCPTFFWRTVARTGGPCNAPARPTALQGPSSSGQEPTCPPRGKLCFSPLVRHSVLLLQKYGAVSRHLLRVYHIPALFLHVVGRDCIIVVVAYLGAASALVPCQEDRVRYEDLHDGLWHEGFKFIISGFKLGTACVLMS